MFPIHFFFDSSGDNRGGVKLSSPFNKCVTALCLTIFHFLNFSLMAKFSKTPPVEQEQLPDVFNVPVTRKDVSSLSISVPSKYSKMARRYFSRGRLSPWCIAAFEHYIKASGCALTDDGVFVDHSQASFGFPDDLPTQA